MTSQAQADRRASTGANAGIVHNFASEADVPWCNGCSYIQLNEKIQAVLGKLYHPLDVVLVSDIGCIGIVDKLYTCHTVHGLHGRSTTLGAGLKMVHDNPNLKVVVFIGDGGCSIGLQNLIDAARLNVELTVLAFDNQNYGMTGGQHSTFTLPDVKTVTTPEGSAVPATDVVQMLGALPGVFRARLTANDPRVPEALEQVFRHRGFAYLETLNFCSSYVGRHNPSLALARAQKFCESFGREFGVFPPVEERAPFALPAGPDARKAPAAVPLEVKYQHQLEQPIRIVLGGSAGGGVQTAAGLFTKAAALCGLHSSLKSDYPVTVGRGHSTCEIILSPQPIGFSGIAAPDLAIVCSEDGRRALGGLIAAAKRVVHQGHLSLENGEPRDFETHGGRNAAFYALTLMLGEGGWFPRAALREQVSQGENEKVRGALLRILEETAS
jgi:pyruvate/2-oxoacid:ferredoxin oxidoreductase beta subunit